MTNIKPVAYRMGEDFRSVEDVITIYGSEQDAKNFLGDFVKPLYELPDGYHIVAIDPAYQAQRKRNFEACLDIESAACLTVDNVRERIERKMLDNINAHNEEVKGRV